MGPGSSRRPRRATRPGAAPRARASSAAFGRGGRGRRSGRCPRSAGDRRKRSDPARRTVERPAAALAIHSHGNTLPAPRWSPVADIADGGASAQPREGALVQIADACRLRSGTRGRTVSGHSLSITRSASAPSLSTNPLADLGDSARRHHRHRRRHRRNTAAAPARREAISPWALPARLARLSTAAGYLHLGSGKARPTFPSVLSASISLPRAFPIEVTATASDRLLIDGGATATLTIPAGETAVALPIGGVAHDPNATVQATTGAGATLARGVRVLDPANPDDAPALAPSCRRRAHRCNSKRNPLHRLFVAGLRRHPNRAQLHQLGKPRERPECSHGAANELAAPLVLQASKRWSAPAAL